MNDDLSKPCPDCCDGRHDDCMGAGPTPFDRVPWSLLAGGVYAAVLNAGGQVTELPDDAEWDRLDQLMGHHITRAAARRTYAATVAAINTDRERNWINEGEG